METKPRPNVFGTAIKVILTLVAVIGVGVIIRVWWPDSNKLAKYCDGGDVSGVKTCLLLGVDLNKPAHLGKLETQTPLTAAAQSGQVEVIRFLISKGADPNLRDRGAEHPHETPLATAAMHGQLEACRVLLDAGADPNIPCEPNEGGAWANWTALDWALQGGHPDVASLLRQHGAVEGHRGGVPPTQPHPFP